MAIDALGPSLQDLFVRSGFQFKIKTVLPLARQLLHRVQYIHSRDYIHRDLKPSNFVMGVGDQTNLVYVIDFGLSKEYRDPGTRAHIPFNTGLGFVGTPAFASINSHMGLELGRRDDLESIAYILFYFLWGFLPWKNLRTGKAILKSKRTLTTHKLFLGLPVEFRAFYEHCRSLSFDDKPNYDHFYDVFGNLMLQEGFQLDMVFDWNVTGGETGRDCADKSWALWGEGDLSTKRVTRSGSQRARKLYSPIGIKSRE